MMTISGISGNNSNLQPGALGGNGQTDSYSKSLQNQIANAKEQLQKLSENNDMTTEAKMEKRQEIQKQITSLQQQLRQHQIEQQKEQRSSRGNDMEELLGGSRKEPAAKSQKTGGGMSKASMQAMISADVSMKQAQAQGSVATSLKGRAGVLEGEIAQDKARGINVEKKEEELAGIKQRTQETVSSQISTLAKASQEIDRAQEAEAGSKKEQKVSNAKEREEEQKISGAKNRKDGAGDEGNNTTEASEAVADRQEPLAEVSWMEGYQPVDVRL